MRCIENAIGWQGSLNEAGIDFGQFKQEPACLEALGKRLRRERDGWSPICKEIGAVFRPELSLEFYLELACESFEQACTKRRLRDGLIERTNAERGVRLLIIFFIVFCIAFIVRLLDWKERTSLRWKQVVRICLRSASDAKIKLNVIEPLGAEGSDRRV